MVFYATHLVADDPMITRDYVEYMTSNSILLERSSTRSSRY